MEPKPSRRMLSPKAMQEKTSLAPQDLPDRDMFAGRKRVFHENQRQPNPLELGLEPTLRKGQPYTSDVACGDTTMRAPAVWAARQEGGTRSPFCAPREQRSRDSGSLRDHDSIATPSLRSEGRSGYESRLDDYSRREQAPHLHGTQVASLMVPSLFDEGSGRRTPSASGRRSPSTRSQRSTSIGGRSLSRHRREQNSLGVTDAFCSWNDGGHTSRSLASPGRDRRSSRRRQYERSSERTQIANGLSNMSFEESFVKEFPVGAKGRQSPLGKRMGERQEVPWEGDPPPHRRFLKGVDSSPASTPSGPYAIDFGDRAKPQAPRIMSSVRVNAPMDHYPAPFGVDHDYQAGASSTVAAVATSALEALKRMGIGASAKDVSDPSTKARSLFDNMPQTARGPRRMALDSGSSTAARLEDGKDTPRLRSLSRERDTERRALSVGEPRSRVVMSSSIGFSGKPARLSPRMRSSDRHLGTFGMPEPIIAARSSSIRSSMYGHLSLGAGNESRPFRQASIDEKNLKQLYDNRMEALRGEIDHLQARHHGLEARLRKFQTESDRPAITAGSAARSPSPRQPSKGVAPSTSATGAYSVELPLTPTPAG